MTQFSFMPRRDSRFGPLLPTTTLVGFWIAISAAVLVAFLSYGALRASGNSDQRVAHSLELLEQLQMLLSTVEEAETSQRGFLLTGDARYLASYTQATMTLADEFASTRLLVATNPGQAQRLKALDQLYADKMAELAQTIALRHQGEAAGALAMVQTDRGMALMQRIRAVTAEMTAEEHRRLAISQPTSLSDARVTSVIILGGAALVLALIVAAALRTARDNRERQIETWVRSGQLGLSERIHGEHQLEKLADRAIGFLAGYLGASSGAVYLAGSAGQFSRLAAFGTTPDFDPDLMHAGDGIVATAAKEQRVLHVQGMPARQGFGAELLVAPASVEGVVYAVVELHCSRRVDKADYEMLSRISESLGIAVRSSTSRTRLEALLNETQRQAGELLTRQEELRKTNVTLELQARALRESQLVTRAQQAEIDHRTSQVEAQKKTLKQQQDQLSIYTRANFMSIATDTNGLIQVFNVGAERMLGYAAAEMLNKNTLADISDPKEVIKRARTLSAKLGTTIAPGFDALVFNASRGIEDLYELSYVRKDGSRFPALVSVTALRDAQGAINGYLTIGTDNSARKRAEHAPAKAGALQSAIFNNVNSSQIATDAKGVIQIYSVGAEHMLGYSAEEVLDKITPADISDQQEIIERAQALSIELNTPIAPGFEAMAIKASRGIEDIYELTYIRKDGSRLPALVTVTALRDAQEVIIGYLLLATDNTAHRQMAAEQTVLAQRLRDHQFYTRSLFESNIDALITTDASGIITDVNKQMETLTGGSRDELIGAPFKIFFTNPDRAELGIKLALRNCKVSDYELTALSKDGKETVVSYNATTLYDRDRKLLGVFAAVREITERKQYERSLREATQKAEHANSAKSEFLANMSHEIRTPLNSVIGLSYLLEHTSLSEDQRQLLSKIQFGGRALLGVINNVLDLAKIEAGEMSLEEQPFNLPEVIRDMAELLAPQAMTKGIKLIVQAEPTLPRMVNGDASRLRQILTNLLVNAIKFTQVGQVELKVSCTEQNSERMRLRCTVHDTGIGIEPEALERLFTPFTQADASTTRRFGGTGLGLSIARRFVELMGGEIGVTSTVAVGSSFWIEVPLRSATSADSTHSAHSVRILIGDSSDAPGGLVAMARALGWSPKVAGSAEKLLQVLRKLQPNEWPDVLILDQQLDDMDVHQLIARLEQEHNHGKLLPIIIVGDPEKSHQQDRQPMRDTDVLLLRPVSSSTLFNAVAASVSQAPDNVDRLLRSTKFDDRHAQWLAGVRVLVVDDSDINQEVARRILEQQGAIVTTCSDGSAAVENIKAHHELIDIVLMDVQMPVLDGNEATRLIRSELQLRALPIVALTAGALVGERQRALEAGMSAFISKPFDPPALIRTVRQVVEQARGEPIPMKLLGVSSGSPHSAVPLMSSIDAGIVHQMYGDDLTLFKSLLVRVLRDYTDLARPISITPGDLTVRGEIQARTHKLRGSAGVIGATAIMRIASGVEQALKENRPANIVEDMLRELAMALKSLRDEADLMFARDTAQLARTDNQSEHHASAGSSEIEELCVLLESQDIAALDRFEVLSSSLSDLLGAPRFDRLHEAIDNLDFQLGAQMLREPRLPIAA